MKAFVEYYKRGAISGELVPALGDRAVVALDARWSDDRLIREAELANGWHRPLYPAYRVYRGDLHNARCIYSTF